MINCFPRLLTLSIFCFLVTSVNANNLQVESGERQNLLLELYTSQGCSSCPPADQWLSKLKGDQRLWQNIFPVAFHVDYWNYIGWRDPFSKDVYSNRQRSYAGHGNVSSVYTPGFIINGKEWRSWFRQRDINTVMDGLRSNPGKLSLSLQNDTLQADFIPKDRSVKHPILNVAWLKMNISTDVLRGENSGKTLRHDFVCHEWQQFEASPTTTDYHWQQQISTAISQQTDALVVWISDKNDPTPVQTVGMRLK